MRRTGWLWLGLSLWFTGPGIAIGDQAIWLTNLGPGLDAPLRDSYGCLLGEGWKAELLIGSDPSNVQFPVGSPASFVSTNGCGTGYFIGGPVSVAAFGGTVYVRVRVWGGAPTYNEATIGAGAQYGLTKVAAVQVPLNSTVYLPVAALEPQFWIGPLTTWWVSLYLDGAFSRDGLVPWRVVVPAGHDLDIRVSTGLFAYRTPLNFQWQKLNGASNWVDIAGATANPLHLPSVEAGAYRGKFNFGCGCSEMISEVDVTVVRIDGVSGLGLTGPAGAAYTVKFKEALSPTNSWQVLTNITLPTGDLSGIDPGFPGAPQRFYQISFNPPF